MIFYVKRVIITLQKYFKLDIIISKFLGGFKMNKANKDQTTKNILKLISGFTRPCTKLKLDNIIFPSWEKLGLLGMIYSQKVDLMHIHGLLTR